MNVTVRAQGSARVRADCIRLTISNETQELKSLTIKRPADDDAVFGVRRGSDLPATVKVQATGFLGTNCSDESTLKLNAQGEVVTGVFPESGVTPIDVFLDPPNSALDSDRDGYVGAARGGLDCKDDDATIFPGAGQVCANTADTDCDGQGGCDDSECGTAAVCADPPDRVVITTSIATMLRHECRGPFHVELHNVNGVRRAIRDTPVALTASLPGVTVHASQSCAGAIDTVTIPYDSSAFDVWLQADATAFGINTLTATAMSVQTPGTAMVEVHPQPIDHLEFVSPPRTVTAGACSTEAVTLEFRDAMNRRTDVDAPTTIALSSNPGDIANRNIFFSDTSCATDSPNVMLSPGMGSVTLYVEARRAGTFQLSAMPSAGTGAMQNLTVQPATASKLAFTNGPVVLNTTQLCSAGVFTVQLQDQYDNPVNAVADVTVRVSVSGLVGVTLFDSSSGCNTAAQTDFVIPVGSSSVSLRARGMVASSTPGNIVASALNGGAITDATQILRISAGVASKFVMTGNPQNPLASVCSGSPFTIELQDSTGNAASSATPVNFTLSTVPAADASFHFYSGAGCQTDLNNTLTVPAGQTSATFYYRGNRAITSFEIRGSSVLTAPSTFLPGNSIRPGPPGKLVFAAPLSQTTQAGVCTSSQYVANVLDLFDNATSFTTAQTVSVTSNPAGVTVGNGTCSSGNSVLLAAGQGQVTFNAQHTVTNPSYALTATVSGFSTATPATMTVQPGPSTLIVDTPAGASATLMAGACQQITLSRRDMYNNNAPTSGSTPVTLSFPSGATWNVYGTANCTGPAGVTPNMNSTHTVTFSVSPQNNSAGAAQVTASINPGVLQSAVINLTVNPGSPTLVFMTPATGMSTASVSQQAGVCLPITIARRDGYQNDVALGSASNVTFTLPTGTTVHSGTPCVPGNSITTIPLLATDARASFYVYATKSAPAPGGPQLQNVISTLAAQSATLALTVSPQVSTTSTIITLPAGGTASLLAHQCQRVNVERRDAFMNLVPAAGTPLTVTPNAADLQVFSATDCSTAPLAGASVPVTAGTSNRDFSLRLDTAGASARNLTVSLESLTAPLSLTISPAATGLFQIQGLPATMTSQSCVGPLTLRRKDLYGNDTTNGTISVTMSSTGTSPMTFSTASDCSGATPTLNVGIADLSAVSGNFYATASLAGAAAMTATQGSVTGMGSVTVNAGSPSQVVFTTTARTFTASTCPVAGKEITVQLRDAAGNPSNAGVGGQALQAVSTSVGGSWFTALGCATAVSGGNYTVPNGSNTLNLYYRDSVVGTPSISINSTLTNPTPQVQSVVPGPAAKLAFTTPARTFTAAQCGGAGSEITVQLQDANGNAVNAGVSGQAFTAASNSTGTVTWFTDNTCSTPVAGTFTIPNGSSSVNLYYVDTKAGTPTITLTNGSGLTNPAGQMQTVNVGAATKLAFTSTAQTLNALTCSAQVTVTLQDAGNNAVNAGTGGRTIQLAGTPAGANLAFYSDSNCTTAIPSAQLTMGAAASIVQFYFKADNAASATLTADTSGIAQGTQGATINAAPVTALVITTAPVTVEAGFCQAVSVERRDALGRQVTTGTTTITPTFAPASGALLFSDSGCTTAIASTFTIPAASATTTVYVKGISGSLSNTVLPGSQAYTFTMTTGGSITDNVVITVLPMVRRRNPSSACTLGNATITCPITPTLSDISRTILFFQAPSVGDDTAGADNVTCRLDPNGGTAQVVCDRVSNGSNISIEWQTVSFPYSYANGGVSVQQVTGGCTGGALTTAPMDVTISSVTTGNTFVLFSTSTTGADNDGEHFFTSQLTSSTNLRINQSGTSTTCNRTVTFDAQVVSWAGATVNRGVTTGGPASSFTASQATAAPGSTFLLYSSRLVDANTANICRRRLRGEITTPGNTLLTFARGCSGVDIQDISWEHVRIPAGSVQQIQGNTSSGQAATSALTISSVDLTRTVGFLGGLGTGGAAGGATTYTTTDRLGAATARVNFNSATQVVYTRGVNDLIGQFTGYIVQFSP